MSVHYLEAISKILFSYLACFAALRETKKYPAKPAKPAKKIQGNSSELMFLR